MTVLDLIGSVTKFAEKTLMKVYRAASDAGAHRILLNLSKVDHINSSGIAILISLVSETQKRSQQLGIICPNEHFRRVFQIVGLHQYAPLHASEEEGLAAMAAAQKP
ncbi:MAG: STAS domain-containing protein [Abditibacteriales bacterium]|nr:STAS domain-containing protein [Abditibacteriales bacterium]